MGAASRYRGKERISHEEALIKLGLRNLGHKELDPKRVSDAFARAFPKVLDKRFPRTERNLQMFKLHWGFEGECPLTIREIGPRFGIKGRRAYELVRAIEGRLARIAQEELRRL